MKLIASNNSIMVEIIYKDGKTNHIITTPTVKAVTDYINSVINSSKNVKYANIIETETRVSNIYADPH